VRSSDSYTVEILAQNDPHILQELNAEVSNLKDTFSCLKPLKVLTRIIYMEDIVSGALAASPRRHFKLHIVHGNGSQRPIVLARKDGSGAESFTVEQYGRAVAGEADAHIFFYCGATEERDGAGLQAISSEQQALAAALQSRTQSVYPSASRLELHPWLASVARYKYLEGPQPPQLLHSALLKLPASGLPQAIPLPPTLQDPRPLCRPCNTNQHMKSRGKAGKKGRKKFFCTACAKKNNGKKHTTSVLT